MKKIPLPTDGSRAAPEPLRHLVLRNTYDPLPGLGSVLVCRINKKSLQQDAAGLSPLKAILILHRCLFVYYVRHMFKAKVIDTFSAAHSLRGYRGDCERLHGHNYRVEVTVTSRELDSMGVVMDFRELKQLVKGILDGLDHRYLNDIEPFREQNPSAENIARHIFTALSPSIEKPLKLHEVVVWENDTCCVSFSGDA